MNTVRRAHMLNMPTYMVHETRNRTEGQRASKSPSMAENLADDDDDDEGFGDFKFIPYPSVSAPSNQINGLDEEEEDDDWGDFIDNSSPYGNSNENPVRFDLFSGISNPQSPPNSSKASGDFDPFGGFSAKQFDLAPNQVESRKTQWVKPQGALPLSIFGDVEDDDEGESGGNDPVSGNGTNMFAHKGADSVQNEPKMNVGVAINDVISSLYDQTKKIEAANATNSNLNEPKSNSNSNGLLLNLNGPNSSPNESNLNVSRLDWTFNGSNMEFVDGNEDSEEDDGWEFRGADMESGGKEGNSKEQSVAELSGLKAESPTRDQEIQKGQENSLGVLHASGFGNGALGSSVAFPLSNGFTDKSSEFDIWSDFKPGTAAQNGFMSDTQNISMQNSMQNGLESYPLEDVEPGEDEWEFQDAFSETRSKHEEEPKIADLSHAGVEVLALDGETLGKVTLVTGGDSGIGRAVAYHFALEGATVAFTYVKSQEEKDARDTLQIIKQAKSPDAKDPLAIPADLGFDENCKKVVDEVVNAFGRIDVLVNNAAEQYKAASVEEIDEERLERVFRTNIFSQFFLVRHALKHMKEGSSIINTTSVNAYKGHPTLLEYTSTKGAILAFTRALALHLVEKGIRVNGVAPGPIWTPLIPASFSEEDIAKFGTKVPMGRAGQPSEVGPCYVFLASNADSSYITGQVLHPNGGTVVNG